MHLLVPSQIPVLCLNVGRSSSKAIAFGATDHAPQEHLVYKISFSEKAHKQPKCPFFSLSSHKYLSCVCVHCFPLLCFGLCNHFFDIFIPTHLKEILLTTWNTHCSGECSFCLSPVYIHITFTVRS